MQMERERLKKSNKLSDIICEWYPINVHRKSQAPDPATNTLLHVVSTLELHVSPGTPALLSSSHDEANYTCRATHNGIGSSGRIGQSSGQPVESTTEFRVHYPPRNISVSHR